MKELSMSHAIRETMHEEMLRDDNVVLIGEDVGKKGGSFGLSKGLIDEFGSERVIDTPISEAGFIGMGAGAAMRGLRPIVELMFMDFIGVCMDQVMNQTAKWRYMTGGQVKVPMVIRTTAATGRRAAGQHAQSLETLFTHIPGLKVVCPSTPADAQGLLKTAIRDDDPVIFIEHLALYAKKGEVPNVQPPIPFGKAAIKREGSDVTIISWSRQLIFAVEAAEELKKEGINAEVIDLRSLVPLDWDTIKESVLKTHNVVIVQEGVRRSGYAGEVSAQVEEELFDELDSPVVRVAARNIVPPYSPLLEDAFFPHPEDIIKAVKKQLNR